MIIISSIYLTAIRYITKATRAGIKLTGNREQINMNSNNNNLNIESSNTNNLGRQNKPTDAYIFSTWAVLAVSSVGYLFGLWNSGLDLSDKGFYLTVFLLGMFSAVTLQKTIRDHQDGVAVTNIYIGLCWAMFSTAIALLVIGLVNIEMMALSEKGFYGMSFLFAIFAVITVQKNTRDLTDEHGNTDLSAFPRASRAVDVAVDGAVDAVDTLG